MGSLEATDIALYAAAFAGLSAVAGIIAAIAAWRSASAARAMVDAEAEAVMKRLSLDAARLAQQVLSKGMSIGRLSNEIKLLYDDLASFSGGVGGSRHKLFKDRAEDYRIQVAEALEAVGSATPSGEPIGKLSEHQLREFLISCTMKCEEFTELASVLNGEKSELQSQVRIHQENAITH